MYLNCDGCWKACGFSCLDLLLNLLKCIDFTEVVFTMRALLTKINKKHEPTKTNLIVVKIRIKTMK